MSSTASKRQKKSDGTSLPVPSADPSSSKPAADEQRVHKSPQPPRKASAATTKFKTNTKEEEEEMPDEGLHACHECQHLYDVKLNKCDRCRAPKKEHTDWVCSDCKHPNKGKHSRCHSCKNGIRTAYSIHSNGATTAATTTTTSSSAFTPYQPTTSTTSTSSATASVLTGLSDDKELATVDLSDGALMHLKESERRDVMLIETAANDKNAITILNLDTSRPEFNYKSNAIPKGAGGDKKNGGGGGGTSSMSADSRHFSLTLPGIRGHLKMWTVPIRLGPASRVNHYGNYKGTKEAAGDMYPAGNPAKAQYIFHGTMVPINLQDLDCVTMQSKYGMRQREKWKELTKRGHPWAARNIPTLQTTFNNIVKEMTKEGEVDKNGDYVQGGKIFEQNRINASLGKEAVTEKKREEMLMAELLKNHVSFVYTGKDNDSKKYVDDTGDQFFMKAYVYCRPIVTKDAPNGKYLSPVIEANETADPVWLAMINRKKIKPVNFKWWDSNGKLIPPDKRVMDVSKGPIVKLLFSVHFKKPEPNKEDSGAGLPGFTWDVHEMQILRNESELITLAPPATAVSGGDEFKPAEDASLQCCGQSDAQQKKLLELISDPEYTGTERVLDLAEKVNKAVPVSSSSVTSSSSTSTHK